MRFKVLLTFVLVALLGSFLTPGAATGAGHPKGEDSVGPGPCSGDTSGDFDDNGSADLAIGVDGEDFGRLMINAGAVNVLYGSSASAGLTALGTAGAPDDQFWHQNSPGIPGRIERRNKFGKCVASGNFNGDDYEDLAIGIPEDNVGDRSNVGSLVILYGSEDGLDADAGPGAHMLRQNSGGLKGGDRAEVNDEFSSSLSSGDFDNDGFEDLAVGAPLEDIAKQREAGAVSIFYGTADGLGTEGKQFFHQDTDGLLDDANADDKFGSSLAVGDVNGDDYADLAIGVAEENLHDTSATDVEAGAVQILYGSSTGLAAAGNQFFTQDTDGVEDQAEDGDHFGWAVTFGDMDDDGYDDLAIGAFAEDVGAVRDAGVVHVLFGSDSGVTATDDQLWSQGNTGSPDDLEADDYFGYSLVSDDFKASNNSADLAIGVPGEDFGDDARDAGAVEVLYSTSTSNGVVTPAQFISQDTPDVEDAAETGDGFGTSLGAGSYDQDTFGDLAIGIPGETIIKGRDGDGAVAVIYAMSGGSGLSPTATPNDEFWHQDVEGVEGTVEHNDLFGRSLA
jgi:hypothetical protein